jgi:DNA polymerase III subunit delta'
MIPSEILSSMLETGKIPQALLLRGPKVANKEKAAYEFARSLLKTTKSATNHPDIHLFFPEGKIGLHPIESVRKISHDAALSPFEGEWKVFIIHDAEKMLPTSANALLKTLEEPPANTLFLLIAQHSEKILPTILSRCQLLEFPSKLSKEIEPKLLHALSQESSDEKLEDLQSDPDEIFEMLLLWYRDRQILEMGYDEQLLFFPNYATQLKKTAFVPLEVVEEKVKLIRLAYERSTKLSLCLEMFFLSLKA